MKTDAESTDTMGNNRKPNETENKSKWKIYRINFINTLHQNVKNYVNKLERTIKGKLKLLHGNSVNIY